MKDLSSLERSNVVTNACNQENQFSPLQWTKLKKICLRNLFEYINGNITFFLMQYVHLTFISYFTGSKYTTKLPAIILPCVLDQDHVKTLPCHEKLNRNCKDN